MVSYVEDTFVRSRFALASCESQHYEELVIATRVMGDIYDGLANFRNLHTMKEMWKECKNGKGKHWMTSSWIKKIRLTVTAEVVFEVWEHWERKLVILETCVCSIGTSYTN